MEHDGGHEAVHLLGVDTRAPDVIAYAEKLLNRVLEAPDEQLDLFNAAPALLKEQLKVTVEGK